MTGEAGTPSPPRGAGVVGLVVLLVVLFGGLGHWIATRSTRSHAPGSLTGAQLYEQYCARCHQPDLRGDARYPPIAVRPFPEAEFDRLVREGSQTMPSFASVLDATDVKLLREYVESVRTAKR
jgi:mono/diheme cytochrome c family protein